MMQLHAAAIASGIRYDCKACWLLPEQLSLGRVPYANAVAHQGDKDQLVASMGLWSVEGTNGRLEDLREYTTKLRTLYARLWLQENLPTWLPNILQLYDRQSQMWQDKIARFKQLESDLERRNALPPAESLGLMAVPEAK